METNLPKPLPKQQPASSRSKTALYQAVWRWHFYAGIIFAPFLIILAVSGSVYLFKPQIEAFMYEKVYMVKEQSEAAQALSLSSQLSSVKNEYPDAAVSAIKLYEDPARTTEFSVMTADGMTSVYVNPYSGAVAGQLKNEEKLTEIFKKLHSELVIGGTFANRLVELAACWAVILLITGLYIWWPRNRASIWGTLLPRFRHKGRIFWRDLHAVPAFWLSIFLLLLILTGLPWSGVMGEQINRLATSTHTGYPEYAHSFGAKPESGLKAGDVAEDVPWAAENMDVPVSAPSGYVPISLEDVSFIAANENIQKPYTISMPQGSTGVYTLATSHSRPGDDATLHVDQYTGAVLSDVRYEDYGIMAKAITNGIALHEGRLFGLTNQIIGLIVCIGLVVLILSSFVMWRKRKPNGKLGAPAKPKDQRSARAILLIMLVLGIIMPLVGISILVVLVLDLWIIPRIKPLRAWLNT